jgi:putative transposase
MLRASGWNHKRVYWIYCKLFLDLRIHSKRRLKRQIPEPLKQPVGQAESSVVHGFHAQSAYGWVRLQDPTSWTTISVKNRRLRRAPMLQVIKMLNQVLEWRSTTLAIRCDNVSEFISHEICGWGKKASDPY